MKELVKMILRTTVCTHCTAWTYARACLAIDCSTINGLFR